MADDLARLRELLTEAQKREAEERARADAAQKEAAEAQRREAEEREAREAAEEREAEAQRREAEAQRREAEAQRREAEAQRREAEERETRKAAEEREAEAQRREAEAQRREAEERETRKAAEEREVLLRLASANFETPTPAELERVRDPQVALLRPALVAGAVATAEMLALCSALDETLREHYKPGADATADEITTVTTDQETKARANFHNFRLTDADRVAVYRLPLTSERATAAALAARGFPLARHACVLTHHRLLLRIAHTSTNASVPEEHTQALIQRWLEGLTMELSGALQLGDDFLQVSVDTKKNFVVRAPRASGRKFKGGTDLRVSWRRVWVLIIEMKKWAWLQDSIAAQRDQLSIETVAYALANAKQAVEAEPNAEESDDERTSKDGQALDHESTDDDDEQEKAGPSAPSASAAPAAAASAKPEPALAGCLFDGGRLNTAMCYSVDETTGWEIGTSRHELTAQGVTATVVGLLVHALARLGAALPPAARARIAEVVSEEGAAPVRGQQLHFKALAEEKKNKAAKGGSAGEGGGGGGRRGKTKKQASWDAEDEQENATPLPSSSSAIYLKALYGADYEPAPCTAMALAQLE